MNVVGCKGQDSTYFEVLKPDCNILGYKHKGLKIVLKNEPATMCSYSPGIFDSTSQAEIFRMAIELLAFQGDTRPCALKIVNYNPLSSQIYMGQNTRYTIQLEALFMLNQLFISSPFNYSPHPLLYDKKNKKYLYGTENEMKGIYQLYINWIIRIKEMGIKVAKKHKIDPLEGSNYKWY